MCKGRPLTGQSTKRYRGILQDHLAVLLRNPSPLRDALLQMARQCLPALGPTLDSFTTRREFALLRLQRPVIDSYDVSGSRQMLMGTFGPGRTPLQKIGFAVPVPHLGPKSRWRRFPQGEQDLGIRIVGVIPANAEVRDHAF